MSTIHEDTKAAQEKILAEIKRWHGTLNLIAGEYAAASFLQGLQGEIQLIPGASVSFSGRSLDTEDELFRDHAEEAGTSLSREEKQLILVEAASKVDEGLSMSDEISSEIFNELERVAPTKEEEITP